MTRSHRAYKMGLSPDHGVSRSFRSNPETTSGFFVSNESLRGCTIDWQPRVTQITVNMFTTIPPTQHSASSVLSGGGNVKASKLELRRADKRAAKQKENDSAESNIFKFINSFRPEDTKSSSNRKAVRSQAARPQHARGLPAAAKVKRRYNRSKRNITFNIQLNVNSVHDEGKGLDKAEQYNDSWERMQIQKPTIMGLQLDGEWFEPFASASSPIRSKSFAPAIINHYLSEMAVDIPELDLEGNHGLLRSKWFPMAMSEAALLQVILLTSASHYAMLNFTTTYAPQLLQMRQEALSFINELLRDPDKYLSDQAIAAVGKMASYEAMYGDEAIYCIHMKGLQRMVRMRGGLSALGLDGLLARMLLWIDNNASFLIKTPLHFASHQTEHGEPLAPPNPALFLGAS